MSEAEIDDTDDGENEDLDRLANRLRFEICGEPCEIIGFEEFQHAVGLAWMMGARVALNTAKLLCPCRVCGCHETDACERGCGWAEPGLCTACAGHASDPSNPLLEP